MLRWVPALMAIGCSTATAAGDAARAPSADPATPAPGAAAIAAPAFDTTVSDGSAAPTPEPSAGEPQGPLPPLRSPTPFVALPVPRHHAAVVSLPLGARTRRPVLVVAHGAGDRPEWQCDVWRELVADRGFVLCVRGFPTNRYAPPEETGFFFADHRALGREISLALEALAALWPDHVDVEAPAFSGFSQGAIMGALLLPQHPARFSRAALVEGGYGLFQEWNIPVAQASRRCCSLGSTSGSERAARPTKGETGERCAD
jgi:predicted esterase